MKVCIAEKPSVAREIAFIIGAKSKKDGYFEGNGYAVTWTFGHLCTLKTPDDYKPEWKKWALPTLPLQPEKFETKLITNKGVKKQFGVIKKLFKQAEVVINCGDAGQEGELIQRWVMNQAKYKGKVLRLWISSLTPEAIREGFKNLRNASNYDNLYYAGFSRAIGDWLLGMNATRLYTLKYGGYKQVLSVGRVQTPTLAMLVARHKEIINFVAKDYWELQTLYRDTQFNCESGRFHKKVEGETWLQQVANKSFEILDFSKKKGKEAPWRLFDLTSLQVHCNKRFGYSADNTLKLVQTLYEKKVVTYPRVDTTYLPNDVYPKIAGILGKMTKYSQFTQPLLGQKIRKSAKVFNDKKVTDHHAIIPTGVEKNLPLTEQNVYDAIARRFIAAFYPDCLVSNTVVIGGVEKAEDFDKTNVVEEEEETDTKKIKKDKFPNHITFKTTGKEILEPGWRVLYPKPPKKTTSLVKREEDTDKKKNEERILPTFKVGENGPHTPDLVAKQTKPPKYYTEATLLRAMETAGKKVDDEELRELMKANGIGRPSTRANIIETLFRRKYAERKKKLLIPTGMGVQLIDTIKSDLLKSAELTGQWEKQLRDIEQGEYAAQQFIGGMRKMVTDLVSEVSADRSTPRLVPVTREANKRWGSGSSNAKDSKEKSRTSTLGTKRKAPKKKKVAIDEMTCPKCKQGKLLKGKAAYGCSNWKTGCSFRLPFSFKAKEIPELQLVRLIEHSSTIQLRGFEEYGRKVNGNLVFNEQFELYLKPKTKYKETPFKKVDRKKAKLAKTAQKVAKKIAVPDKITCPLCKNGTIMKGKTAYGCSDWKTGCDFRYTFEAIRAKANGKALTKELVWAILKGK